MEILTLCISILSLIIGSVAYYRSGGKQDMRALEQTLTNRIEELGATVRRASDSVAATVRAGYERSTRIISDLQAQVAALRKEAVEEIQEDLRMLAQTLDRLAERAAREVKEVKADVSLALAEAEEALRLAVEETKARLKVIQAKQELGLARIAILRSDLIDAEPRVESALRHLEEARSLTAGHVESVTAVQKQAQEMLVAIRRKASTMKASLDALIERNNRLLAEMSSPTSAEKTAA
jgi:hypothetical protein